MADDLKGRHERAVGDRFIERFNNDNRTAFVYHGRPVDAPDLHYRDEERDKYIEITDAYYDESEARWRWSNIRDEPDAPTVWFGQNADEKLIDFISAAITAKSGKSYGPDCTLLVNVRPPCTTAEELDAKLRGVRIPEDHPFAEIYITGDFGESSSGSGGGYHLWRLA